MFQKSSIFIQLTLWCTILTYSQSNTIDNVGVFFFNNFGSLENNSVSYFYSFHTTNTSQKDKSLEGMLTFYDQDLNIKKTEQFSLNTKNNMFLEAKNDAKNAMIALYNPEKEVGIFKIYSNNGEIVNSQEISLKKDAFNPGFYKNFETIGDFCLIYPSKNKGFLITETTKKKRLGYNIHFLSANASENWVYSSPEDHNNRKTVCPMYTDEKVVILLEKEWGSVYDRQPTFTTIVLDSNTGKKLFEVSHAYEDVPNFTTHATINDKGEIVLFGELYKKDNNYPDNDYNLGYFMEKYSLKGELIAKNDLQFENTLIKRKLGIPLEEKQKNYGTIFFHRLESINGKYYVIGEKAVRTKQGFTIANAILSQTIGGATGALISNNWQTKYTIENGVVWEMDENLELVKAHPLVKEKNETGLNTMVVRPYFNYKEMFRENKLDYQFTTISAEKNQNIFYLDRKINNQNIDFRLKKSVLSATGLESIEFAKIVLKENEKYFNVQPLLSDKIFLMKYDTGENKILLSVLEADKK